MDSNPNPKSKSFINKLNKLLTTCDDNFEGLISSDLEYHTFNYHKINIYNIKRL